MSKQSLHQRRVKALRKLRGQYFSIKIRGRRHAEQLRFALREVGYTFDTGVCWAKYNPNKEYWIMYKDMYDTGLYTHTGTGNPKVINHFL